MVDKALRRVLPVGDESALFLYDLATALVLAMITTARHV